MRKTLRCFQDHLLSLRARQYNSHAIDTVDSIVGPEWASFSLLNKVSELAVNGAYPEGIETLIDEILNRQYFRYYTHLETYQIASICVDLVTNNTEWSTRKKNTLLDKALVIAPDYPDALALKAIILVDLNQRLTADYYMAKAITITLSQTNEGAAYIGKHYFHSNNPAKAGEAWIRLRQGQYFLRVGDLLRAEEAVRQSLTLFDQNGWANSLLALVLEYEGRCADALPYAKSAVQLLRDYLPFHKTLGDVYWCLGNAESAVSIYSSVVKADPSYLNTLSDRLP